MKDYEKNAAIRRAKAELALQLGRIREEAHDRMKQHVEAESLRAINDGRVFNADEVGKAATAFGIEPWTTGVRALEYKAPAKARKR